MPLKPAELHQCPHVQAGAEPWLHLTITPAARRADDPETPSPDDHELCALCADATIAALAQVSTEAFTPTVIVVARPR